MRDVEKCYFLLRLPLNEKVIEFSLSLSSILAVAGHRGDHVVVGKMMVEKFIIPNNPLCGKFMLWKITNYKLSALY